MTESELLARIKELEDENEALRAVAKMRKPSKPICPDWIGEKYGGKKLPAGHYITSLSFMRNAELTDVSRLIRAICFPKDTKNTKLRHSDKRVSKQYAIKVEDMSEAQYEKYCGILDEVLAILYKNTEETAA